MGRKEIIKLGTLFDWHQILDANMYVWSTVQRIDILIFIVGR